MPTRRQTLTALGLAGASLAGITACKNDGPGGDNKEPEPKAKAAITTPIDGEVSAPAGVEIEYSTSDATQSTFELKDGAGNIITGAMHPDGKGWMPDKMLEYGGTYTATLTATGDDGRARTVKSTFTVMTQPNNLVNFASFVSDNTAIGTGYPLIIQLSREIPKDSRAAVQRRMFVTTDPPVEGVWSWYRANELHWRPKEFWKPETKIFVDVRTGGIPCGDGFFGRRNLSVSVTAGRQLVMKIDDAVTPKEMVVTIDGQEAKRIPVSLGKPEWESSTGVMVIMEKKEKDHYDTSDDPGAREIYQADVEYSMRLTWSGEHIHAAPWSVGDQGVRNVSHGCVNMSTENAKWLFEQVRIGDPVVVLNTGRPLKDGDGWTDWTKSFEDYAEGSAIPYVPPASPAPS